MKSVAIILWGLAAAILMILGGAILRGVAAESPAIASNVIYVSPLFPLLLGFIAIVHLKVHKRSVGTILGFSKRTILSDLLLGVSIGAVCILIAIVSLRFMSTFAPLPALGRLPPSALVFAGTIGAIVPGVGEELYYRGMMFKIGESLPPALLLILWNERAAVGGCADLPEDGARDSSFPATVERPSSIHRDIMSAENLQGFVDALLPDTKFAWYSGNSSVNAKGSLISNIPATDSL